MIRRNCIILLMTSCFWFGIAWAGPVQAQSSATTNGFDTPQGSGLPLTFANQGQKVGEWNATALVANGGVRVGQDLTACSPSLQGELRWIAASPAHMEACNGSFWAEIPPSGSLCGSVFVEYDSGTCGQFQMTANCQGLPLLTSCNMNAIICPSGFTPKETSYSWGNNNGYIYQYFNFSCVSN